MKQKSQKSFCAACGLLVLFGIWTYAVCHVDVQPIGANHSMVGFAGCNAWFHKMTGVHWMLYTVTDWLSIVPFCFVLGFAVLGLRQWMQRKRLCRVDCDILLLGVFYLLVMAAYLLFETVVINYRPVLIQGALEASYPSSTTMLVLCVMPTAMMQLHDRVGSKTLRSIVLCVLAVFTAVMTAARLLSGVHWLTDILGGMLLSAGLVMLYYAVRTHLLATA